MYLQWRSNISLLIEIELEKTKKYLINPNDPVALHMKRQNKE